MMFRKPRLWLVCLAAVGAFAIRTHAFGQQITLDYEPKKGNSATYDVIVHSEAADTAGFSLVTDMTSTVTLKITDVTRDKSIPVGKNNIVAATTELTQKNGSVKVVSGETEKTFPLQDVTLQLTSDAKGMVKEAPAGMDQAILDMVAAVYSQVGTAPTVVHGQTWKMNLQIPCGVDSVPAEVTWSVADHVGSVAGQTCVLITSEGKASREFKEGPMKKVSIEWTGEAAYAFKSGKFARIAVSGTSNGDLEDDSAAQGKFSFEMVLAKKQASLPSHRGILAGLTLPAGGGPRFPMMLLAGLGVALLGALAATARRRTLRRAFACAMVLLLAVYGMPVNTAQAATPGAILAFANLMNQTIMSTAGWTAAGGAGICMNGAPAASLGVPYSSAPPWAGANLLGVTAGLTPDFVQPAVAEVPAEPEAEEAAMPVAGAEKTSAGLFTGTNMLIGGGVLLAGGGAAVAAGGGGGGGGGAVAPAPPYGTAFTNFSTTEATLMILVAPGGLGDTPADVVSVRFNGTPLLTNYTLSLGSDTFLGPLALNMGANQFVVEAVSGGSNGFADVNTAFVKADLGDLTPPQQQDVSVPVGNSATCTITRE